MIFSWLHLASEISASCTIPSGQCAGLWEPVRRLCVLPGNTITLVQYAACWRLFSDPQGSGEAKASFDSDYSGEDGASTLTFG